MAQINELTEVTSITLDDKLPIWDNDASATRKVSLGNLSDSVKAIWDITDFGAELIQKTDDAAAAQYIKSAYKIANYTALRAYTGSADYVSITDPLTNGSFYLDAADTTSADNNSTTIIDALNRRWKRQSVFAYSNSIQFGTPTNSGDGAYIDKQLQIFQVQNTYSSNGVLGAGYFQRLGQYTGGESTDLTAPVIGAVRGYNQVGTGVGRVVEVGGLFVTDNYSYNCQAVGVVGQANSWHGGRTWGGVFESHEKPETFTATAGQTTFTIPNGYTANKAIVKKNGTVLTRTTQYVDSSGTNIVLVSAAAAGDIITIYRGSPKYASIGVEVDCFGATGNDDFNSNGGNRVVGAFFGYGADSTIPTTIGTGLAIIADPSNTNLTINSGIRPQGKINTFIDLTASNLSLNNYIIKGNNNFTVSKNGNTIIGDIGEVDLAGYGVLQVGRVTNGGLFRVGDGTHFGRISCSSSSGVVIGSDTNIDVILTHNSTEKVRLSTTAFLQLASATSFNYANDAAAASGGVPIGGVYHNAGNLKVRIS